MEVTEGVIFVIEMMFTAVTKSVLLARVTVLIMMVVVLNILAAVSKMVVVMPGDVTADISSII